MDPIIGRKKQRIRESSVCIKRLLSIFVFAELVLVVILVVATVCFSIRGFIPSVDGAPLVCSV